LGGLVRGGVDSEGPGVGEGDVADLCAGARVAVAEGEGEGEVVGWECPGISVSVRSLYISVI
jgi:hypothetical protein